jgi:hypothetical protein
VTTFFPARSLAEAQCTNPWIARGRRATVAALVLGAAFDLMTHRAIDGRTGTLCAIVAATAMCIGGRVRRIPALAMAGLIPLFAMWLSVRTSPWLLTLDLVAIVGLLFAAAGFGRAGHPLDVTFVDAARHGAAVCGSLLRAPLHVFGAVAAVGSGSSPDPIRRREIARGVALALPIVVAAAILLATADGVFASFLHLPFGADDAIGHVDAVVFGASAALVLIAHVDVSVASKERDGALRFGTVEVTMVLGALVALYTLFAVSQALALTRGADYVRRTTGLTYAEYARRGYFQLLAVAALTALVLLAVRPYVRRASTIGRRALVLLGEAAVALTLVIILSAIHRLDVYGDAFGLTMLRLSCVVFAYWLAAVFVLVAIGYVRRDGRQWLAPAVVISALVTLFLWNAANPEAIVARHNVARANETLRFDPEYLASLSADAVPALVDGLPRLEPADRVALTNALCREHEGDERDFWSANRSHRAARRALETLC